MMRSSFLRQHRILARANNKVKNVKSKTWDYRRLIELERDVDATAGFARMAPKWDAAAMRRVMRDVDRARACLDARYKALERR